MKWLIWLYATNLDGGFILFMYIYHIPYFAKCSNLSRNPTFVVAVSCSRMNSILFVARQASQKWKIRVGGSAVVFRGHFSDRKVLTRKEHSTDVEQMRRAASNVSGVHWQMMSVYAEHCASVGQESLDGDNCQWLSASELTKILWL